MHRWAIVVVVLLAASLCAAPAIEAQFDAKGLSRLSYADASFVGDGAFQVYGANLRSADGLRHAADMKGGQRSFDAATRTLSLTWPWGTVRCAYTIEPTRLRLSVTVENLTDETIADVTMSPMESAFPSPPAGWVPHMPYRTFNLGWPTTLVARMPQAVLAACNEDVARPLQFGWQGRESLARRPMILATVSDWNAEILNPQLSRPIAPHASDRYDVSLRFGPAGATDDQVFGDLLDRFAKLLPYRLNWTDRRPIGALFPSSSGINGEKNPRGWFNDKQADFVTEEGRAKFRERLMAWAGQSVQVLKGLNAQGMITWDTEGQEYPHAISYLGDPRSLPPEMEPVADAYFKLFTDAGLKVGVCLRPQLPLRTAYGAGVNQYEVTDPLATLDAKLTYAQKRWGCTLFYVDSNGDPNAPMSASIFSQLAARHPDVLLMPEHENAAYYACSAPYRDYQNQRQLGTGGDVRRLYPNAFCALYLGDRDVKPVREQLIECVKHGDILVVHGWYSPANHKDIKEIVAAAAK